MSIPSNISKLSYAPKIIFDKVSPLGQSPMPRGLGIASAIPLAVAAMGLLGGDEFRDNQLKKIGSGYTYNPETGLTAPVHNPNTGKKITGATPPPFSGGQSAGVIYRWRITHGYNWNYSQYPYSYEGWRAGAISMPIAVAASGTLGTQGYFALFWSDGTRVVAENFEPTRALWRFEILYRQDGQPDTGGNLPSTGGRESPSGYNGNSSELIDRNKQPIIIDAGALAGVGSGDLMALGMGSLKTGLGASISNSSSGLMNGVASSIARGFAPTPIPAPSGKPASPPPTKQPIPPPTKQPIPTPEETKKEQEKKSPFPPPPPVSPPPPNIQDVTNELARLGAIIGTIAANTTPEAGVQNAKTGSCQSLNDPSCTAALKNDIKNPINQNIDAKTAALAANQLGQDVVLGSIKTEQVAQTTILGATFKFISSLYNNQFVQSTINYLTFATTIHNAAMLSRDLGETLGEVVDNGLTLAGRQFKDSEGNQVQFTELVGNNAKALISSVLGAEKYAELTLKWQKASAIFNTGASILSTTQSMLDPLSTAIEYGMENVSKIGNNLRDDGVVSENAYPRMDETIRARRVSRFARLTDTLEGADDVVSNLSSVTSSAVSIKEDYKQLREDKKALTDKLDTLKTTDDAAIAAIKADIPTFTDLSLAPVPDDE